MRVTGTALVALLSSAQARADDADLAFFEARVRPILVKHCYPCHSHEANKSRGGLLLDQRDGLLKGGQSGPAVVVGKPEQSLLIKAVRYEDEALKMPPAGKLPAAVVADLERWIKEGAAAPAGPPTAKVAASWAETLRQRSDWWSLKPVRGPVLPKVANAAWSEHPVDRFLLARLEAQGLSPAGPADPRTLARRLSLVLTGLPPTEEQLGSFLAECDRAGTIPRPALEKLVDTLLESPHFGERWARHWMDVVRFTETHGNEWNYEVHHAWRYRDYLIRAFNADVPYDQFVREHIAGDLLPRPRWSTQERFNESVIGTAFYRFGEVNHDDCITLPQIGYDVADNQIDTLTKAFQATTVACARCHDHKLDAISAEDYHALLGVLRSSRMVSHCIDSAEVNAVQRRRLGELKKELRRELARQWLAEAPLIAHTMQAAQAHRDRSADAVALAKGLDSERLAKWIAGLGGENQPFEDVLSPWRQLAGVEEKALADRWRQLGERVIEEDRQRSEFNRSGFLSWADFRAGDVEGWQVGGQGLLEVSRSGDFVVDPAGERVVRAVLPAGRYTCLLSDKLNGTLRSPVVPAGRKYISFQVIGEHSSAVRLVSNNCQLNYVNYRALTSGDWRWITFAPPAEREQLRTYAELMTMFDNPKFPDQLSALGGDPANYRLTWEKAAENPRSYFGITRVVLHDGPAPPKPEVGHLRRLFAGEAPRNRAELATRYASVIEAVLTAWAEDRASDEDVRWLDGLLRRELLGNQRTQSPRLAELVRQYRQTEGELALPRVVPGVGEGGPGIEQPVLLRGDLTRPGKAVPRRYLEVLSPGRDVFRSPGSGRLELAERIASADNPLTARVMVNRVWHHLFGTGLVRTVDDFGHLGEMPSHPELLDHLAAQFMADGWSVKKLIRSLVLTRAFQMANQASPAAREVDPLNRLLQHYPARRLEAEAIRDSILAVSGRLDRQRFGMSIQPYREKEYADRRLFPGPLDGNGRRSIYIKCNLMEGPKFLSAFDFPGGKVAQGRRDVTNAPAQALALLNDPFVLQQAEVWASRLVARPAESIDARVEVLFLSALQRPPTASERDRFARAVEQLAALHGVRAGEVMKSRAVWKDLAHTLFNLSEFVYIP